MSIRVIMTRGDCLEVRQLKNLKKFPSELSTYMEQPTTGGNRSPRVNRFKNRLDRYWRDQDLLYDYKAKLNTDRKTAGGRMEVDLDIEAADSRQQTADSRQQTADSRQLQNHPQVSLCNRQHIHHRITHNLSITDSYKNIHLHKLTDSIIILLRINCV